MEEYFAVRRVQVSEKKPPTVLIESYHYHELLETGRCMVAPCSPREGRLLAVVKANLDIVEKDLEAVIDRRPSPCATPGTARSMDGWRADALQVLQIVARIRRGEATIGKIRKRDMWKM
jgi:hypothetical protein